MMKIEQWLRPSLADEIRALVAEACDEGFEWMGNFEDVFSTSPFNRSGEGLFVAREGGQLAGVAVISEDHHLQDGHTGRLRFIFVRRNFRGRGIANALTARCLAHAGTRWTLVRLHTDNPAAARLYAKHGFVRLDRASAEATHAKVVE